MAYIASSSLLRRRARMQRAAGLRALWG